MTSRYDRTKDATLVRLPGQRLPDGRDVKAEVFSYAGGSPKLRVRVGTQVVLKADRAVLETGALYYYVEAALAMWPGSVPPFAVPTTKSTEEP